VPARIDASRQTRLRGLPVFRGIFRPHDLLIFRATGRTFPWHTMTCFQGGESGCAGPTVRERDAWKLLSLTSRGHLLVRLQRVWWMTGNTGFAFHEWIGLQLCHQLGVTSLAYAHPRLGREALCHVTMAHGACDLVDAMRPGIPFRIQPLMAVGTVFSGWNLRMRFLLACYRQLGQAARRSPAQLLRRCRDLHHRPQPRIQIVLPIRLLQSRKRRLACAMSRRNPLHLPLRL